MRTQLTIAAAAGFVLAACSGETVAPPPAAPVDWLSFQRRPVADAGTNAPTAKERALAEQYTSAIESPGFDPLAPLFDDDAHFAFPGKDDTHGRDSVVRAHAALFGAFDDRKLAMSRVWRTPSAQIVEWTMSGSHARDWMGIAASHKPVAFEGLTLLWTKDDGTITDMHVYFDVAVVKAQLGVGPKELQSLPAPGPVAVPKSAPLVFEQAATLDDKAIVSPVRTTLDALENGDEAAYVGAMADDVEIHSLERVQPMRGRDDARAYFKAMRRVIGQLDTTIGNAWGIAQFAIVEYQIAGDQLGSLGYVRAQRDRVIVLHVVDVVEIRQSKIARVWRYDNPAEITTGM